MFPLIFSMIRNENDRIFMEKFYEQYHKLIYSQVCKLTKDEYDVEEIVQESLIGLIKRVETLQTLPKDRLVNYSISVARYTAYAYIRKKKRFESVPFENNDVVWHSQQVLDSRLDELVIKKIEGEKLYYIWTHLKVRDQALLNMKYILDYTNEEIAEVLDVKPESIRMMLTRAKRSLSTELEKVMG